MTKRRAGFQPRARKRLYERAASRWYRSQRCSARWSDDDLAATIFHELAHQRLYVKGDTEFNESFATFVQREGLRQWRVARGLAPAEGHHPSDGQP